MAADHWKMSTGGLQEVHLSDEVDADSIPFTFGPEAVIGPNLELTRNGWQK